MVDVDWVRKEVLLVTFDDLEDGRVDRMTVNAKNVGLYYVNMVVGNVSWGEYKEGEAVELVDGGGQ